MGQICEDQCVFIASWAMGRAILWDLIGDTTEPLELVGRLLLMKIGKRDLLTLLRTEPCLDRGVGRPRALGARTFDPARFLLCLIEANRIEIGDHERFELKEIEEGIEDLRICAADLDGRYKLPVQSVLLFQLRIDEFAYARHENTFGRALDKDRLVGKIKIALRQRHILVKKLAIGCADRVHPFPEILDLCLAHTGRRSLDIQEVADGFKLCSVGKMRRMGGDDELYLPCGLIGIVFRERLDDRLELVNENFLHLRVHQEI